MNRLNAFFAFGAFFLLVAAAEAKRGSALPLLFVFGAIGVFMFASQRGFSLSKRSEREDRERAAREQEEENRRKLIAEANARLEEPLPREVSPLEERLRRGERDVRAWVADIRTVAGSENRGFREASIPPDALWSVVEDEAADAGARVAAAIALNANQGEVARERLRIAARTTESPTLRVAVAAAEEASDEELVKLLKVLEE